MRPVGGTVTGLAGFGLVLNVFYTNNLGPAPSSFVDALPVSAPGTFTFGRRVAGDTAYAVGVQAQPSSSPAQYCSLANFSGTVAAANVTNVSVTCGAGYTVGGTVSGLVDSGLVLQIENTQIPNDRSDPDYIGSPLPVKANGAFTLDSVYPAIYPATFFSGDFVKITQQPSSPTQRCLIENAGISIQGANDTSVAVLCSEFADVANAADNTLSAYRVDATSGALLPVGTPTATGKSPYAVVGTYDRKFVYVANEGSNDISAFAVNIETGVLTAVPGSPFAAGTGPRALTLNRDFFLYVANTGSKTISAFAINAATGALTPLSPATYATGQGPSSLTVNPTYSFLYVANNGGSNDISAFVIDSGTGGLTSMAGSPFAAGGSPLSLAFGASGKFLYTANPGGTTPEHFRVHR
jgi:6-phosphogluconolactonase